MYFRYPLSEDHFNYILQVFLFVSVCHPIEMCFKEAHYLYKGRMEKPKGSILLKKYMTKFPTV